MDVGVYSPDEFLISFSVNTINRDVELNLWDRTSGNLLLNVEGTGTIASITGRTLGPGNYVLGASEDSFNGADGFVVQNGDSMMELSDGSPIVTLVGSGAPTAQIGLSAGSVVIEAALFCFTKV